jgi:DNA-binding MarR family transcriptional regulator
MEIQLEDTIGYWLFYSQRCAEYAFFEALKRCCIEQGKSYVVTPPQWGILSTLFPEQQGLPIGVISQRQGFDPPTITGIVKRLEQSGLVERRHNHEDRRVVKVYLTDEGREIMPPLSAAVIQFNATMTQGFSPAEKKDLMDKMQQLIVNLAAVAPGTGDRFHLLPGHVYEAE